MGCKEVEVEALPAGWVGPGQSQRLAGGGLDAAGAVVDDVGAALGDGEGREGENEGNPGTHGDCE